MEVAEWDGDPLPSNAVDSPIYHDYPDFLDVDFDSVSEFSSPVEDRSPPGAWPAPDHDSRAPYSYQPLCAGPWIRILRLKPGGGRDPIKCSIHSVLLDDVVGQYDALSYVWGPNAPSYSIEVDGGIFTIRENLFRLLERIRLPDESLDLWADAICIDQDSIEEKNHQVQQMGNIYRGSRTTRLWLGQGDRRVKSFLSWTARYSPTALLNGVSAAVIEGLDSILDNHYWTRLWIVQEVILSPEVRVYVAQNDYLWADFVHYCKLVVGGIDILGRIEIVEKLSRSTMLNLHRQRTVSSQGNFPDLIRNFCTCQCFDVRDRVFGLRGLVKDFAFEVDCELSRLQLFEKITSTYPAQFAEDLAEVLWTALEMFSEPDLAFDVQPSLTIPVRVQEFGFIVRQDGRLKWDQHPKQILLSDSEFNDERYRLCSLSMTPAAASRGAKRFLIVLRDQRFQNDTDSQISKPKKISYAVAGAALVFHPAEEIMESTSSDLGRSLVGAQTSRDARSIGYGPLILQIPIRAFVEIGSAYGFRQSNESPHYNVGTNRHSLRSGFGLYGRDRDGDEGAMAFPVDEQNPELVLT